MKRSFHLLLSLFLFAAFSAPASAEVVRVAVSLSLPPYVFEETNSGMDLEIAKEALALEGHKLEPVYVVYGRTARDLKLGKVDGALTVSRERGVGDVFLSDPYICFQDIAVSLKSRGYRIESPADLADKRIVTFQDAKKLLGEEFAAAADASPYYYEIPDQESQVALLYKGRTDTIVLDLNVFRYFRANNSKADTSAPVAVHEIFQPIWYSAGFKERRIRDDFNKGLKRLRASGRYQAIIDQYAGY